MDDKINRRDFLKFISAGLIGGGLMLLSPLHGNKVVFRGDGPVKSAGMSDGNPRIAELKKKITDLQIDIKNDKISCASGSRMGRDISRIASRLPEKQRQFRHYQIAYSELRGRARKEIEVPSKKNRPDELLISRLIRKYS